jgi:hypothetical protein
MFYDNSAHNTKHKPSAHAMEKLADIAGAADGLPTGEVNFTVREKLEAFGYIKIVSGQTIYKSHPPGKLIDFMIITDKGWNALRGNR